MDEPTAAPGEADARVEELAADLVLNARLAPVLVLLEGTADYAQAAIVGYRDDLQAVHGALMGLVAAFPVTSWATSNDALAYAEAVLERLDREWATMDPSPPPAAVQENPPT